MDPTSKLTYADTHVGIPVLVNCVQMVPISLFFHYAYTFRPYVISKGDHAIRHTNAEGRENVYVPQERYQGGFLGHRALLLALNPIEVFEGIYFAFKMATELAGNYNGLDRGGSESEDMLASRSQDAATGPQPPYTPGNSGPNQMPQQDPQLGHRAAEQYRQDYRLPDYGDGRTGHNGRTTGGRRRGGPVTMLLRFLSDKASGR